MIDSITLADGTKRYWNVGKARINGFELQLSKSLGWLEGSINYTNIDHRNESDNRPLDAISGNTLSFDLTVRPVSGLRFSVFGLSASESPWYDSTSRTILRIPGYFNLDAVAAYDFGRLELFVKVTNIFDDYLYSEPIFPWRTRFFEFGARVDVF